MKTSTKIIFKIAVFLYLLSFTPFYSMLPDFLHLDVEFATTSIYEQELIEEDISIKDQLNLMKVDEDVMLSSNYTSSIEIINGDYVDNSVKKENVDNNVKAEEKKEQPKKKVYIYNTHQVEGYNDGKTVVDASVLLANRLQEENIQVVYEINSFPDYLKANGLDYNSSYSASYYYLNEALVNYGGFDLVIDFHRDSVPRESSYTMIKDKSYAKIMFVIGGLSSNVGHVTQLSNELTDIIESLCPGVVKAPMTREAYYNQQVYKNSILVEMGSDNNSYEEVSNSTNLLADAIIQYLR